MSEAENLRLIVQAALDNGASQAAVVSPEDIFAKDQFAAFCKDPGCPNYGKSMSCPPYVSGPAGFRKRLGKSQHAITIRLEVDAASLIGDERPQVFRLLQEITAATELKAKSLGFNASEGFAGGSCKRSFCDEHEFCRVLQGNGKCRHPNSARPSMSGYGVNVGKLMKAAGWGAKFFSFRDADEEQMIWLAGLVLIK